MRTFLNGSGVDTTASALAYLAAHKSLWITDLIVVNTAPNYSGHYLGKTFLLTPFPSPLKWNYKGIFKPAQVSRGQVESKIGLEADTLDVTWDPRDTDILATDGSGNTILTALQGFNRGVFDNGIVEVWRCLMPTMGDCNTIGACLMFSGRIGDIKPDRATVTMTIMSRLELLNIQVPTNLIEPTNILAQYTTGQGASAGGAQVNIPGTTMPWNTTANPSYDYGIHDGTSPVVVNLSSLLGFAGGVSISIVCRGEVQASDSRPYVGPNGQYIGKTSGSVGRFPSYYMTNGASVGLVEVVGAWLDGAGHIVGTPFAIGASFNGVPPAGATDLSIGVNDDHFADNVGAFFAHVAVQGQTASFFTVVSGSTRTKVYADATPTMPAGTYDGGYILFGSGAKLEGSYAAVRAQTVESGHHAFYLYGDPVNGGLPFDPTVGDTFGAFIPVPRDYSGALNAGTGFAGFPFCPQPVNSNMIIA